MPPVGAGTFRPSPMLVFYIPLCKCLPAWNEMHGMLNTCMGEGQNVPAPIGSFPFPELQFSRGELHLISCCYSVVDTVQHLYVETFMWTQ
jgi:hypothetical protein